MDKLGIAGIMFFALLALWLLWKSVVLPLLSVRAKQKVATFIGYVFTGILLGVLIALLIVSLHLFGLGVIELLKSFGLEKFMER